MLQNELSSDVAHFTTHIKPILRQIRLLPNRLNVGGKTCIISFQLVIYFEQLVYKTSCTFLLPMLPKLKFSEMSFSHFKTYFAKIGRFYLHTTI